MNWEVLQNLNAETVKFFNPKPENVVGIGTTYDDLKYAEGYEKPSKEAFEVKLQELIDAQPLKDLRAERDTLLSQTDKYATIDYPHGSEAAKQVWLDYRQALRDLPANTNPSNPVWPEAPN